MVGLKLVEKKILGWNFFFLDLMCIFSYFILDKKNIEIVEKLNFRKK